MEPKLRDLMIELQKINRRLDKIDKNQQDIQKQLGQVSKTVSPFQTTGPYQPIVTTAPLPPLPVETVTRYLDGTAVPEPTLEDNYCEKTVNHKHVLPIAWAGPGPVLCQVCGKNTGGVIR